MTRTDTTRKALVAYATRAGSTAGVAERVAEVLNRSGFAAQAIEATKVEDTAPYDAVVLGSSVRAGKLKPEALKFLDKNKADINSKPFTARAYLDPVRLRVKPASEGLFAGTLDLDKLGFVERTIMKAMKAESGDFRKWDEVEAWAASLAPLFSTRPA